jgi:hypothetical protein
MTLSWLTFLIDFRSDYVIENLYKTKSLFNIYIIISRFYNSIMFIKISARNC